MLLFGQACVSQKVVMGNKHSSNVFARHIRIRQGTVCGKRVWGKRGDA